MRQRHPRGIFERLNILESFQPPPTFLTFVWCSWKLSIQATFNVHVLFMLRHFLEFPFIYARKAIKMLSVWFELFSTMQTSATSKLGQLLRKSLLSGARLKERCKGSSSNNFVLTFEWKNWPVEYVLCAITLQKRELPATRICTTTTQPKCSTQKLWFRYTLCYTFIFSSSEVVLLSSSQYST